MLSKLNGYLTGGLAIVVAGLLLFTYIQNLRLSAKNALIESKNTQIDQLNHDIDLAKAVNDANVASVDMLQKNYDRLDGIAQQYQKIDNQRTLKLRKTLEDINRAPLSDDAPVAPVLLRQLERMRGVPAPAKGNPDKGTAGSTPTS